MTEAQPTELEQGPPEDSPEAPPAPIAEPEDTPTPVEEPGGGLSKSVKYAIGLVVAMMAVILLGSVIAIIVALADPGAADKIGAVRDVFIIVLAWFSILIGASLIILILQIASLFNLIKNEVIPIMESFQKTAKTVRGTTNFMSQNLARPVIRATGFFAYIRAFLEYLRVIRRAELNETFIEENES